MYPLLSGRDRDTFTTEGEEGERSVTGRLSAYRIDRNGDSKAEETKTDTISVRFCREKGREREREATEDSKL